MKHPAVRYLACLLGTGLLLGTSLGHAVEPETADRATWQSRYAAIASERDQARQAFENAHAYVTRERNRKRLRGETRRAAYQRLASAQERLALAERAWRDFPSEARRAGALPGWFR